MEGKEMKWFTETNYGRDTFFKKNIVMEFYYMAYG